MKNNNQTTAWLFLSPAIFFFLVFSAYPIIKSIQLSFYDAGVLTQEFIGFQNYISVFSNPRILKSFINSGKFTLLIVPIVTSIPLIIAVIGYRMHRTFQTIIRFAYYIPVLTAGPIVTMVWLWLLHPTGIINQLLGQQVFWFGSNPEAFFAISMIVISVDMGMTIIIYSAAMTTIDTELYDAAKIDGCNGVQEDWYITRPLIMPTVGFIFFIKIVGISQIWLYPYILTGGGPNYGTNTAVLEIYLQAFNYGKYGFASAIGVLFAITIGTIGYLQRRFFRGDMR
jgi:multiple sugar transport system permease protein